MQWLQFQIARADTGAILSNPKVYVYYNASPTTLVQLYDAGGSPIGNPVTGDTFGQVGFAVADGLYDFQATSNDGTYSLPRMVKQLVVDVLAGMQSGDGERTFSNDNELSRFKAGLTFKPGSGISLSTGEGTIELITDTQAKLRIKGSDGVIRAFSMTLAPESSAPTIVTANTISGVVGGTLTNTPGTYTGSPTVTYQWQKKIGAAYVDIAGATSATLASSYASHGNNIRCNETATNAGGSVSQATLPALYLGQVATNCARCTHIAPGISSSMSRSLHVATDDITSLQLVLANWYWVLYNASPPPTSKTEQGSGGTATFRASIEYPVGTFTQVLFGGGATSSSIADGSNCISDAVSVTIPKGSIFYVREYAQWASSNLVYISGFSVTGGTYDPTNYTANLSGNGSTGGEALKYISATDQTMSGTVSATVTGNNGPIRRPLAIIANTRVPSVAIVGDSIALGQFDKYDSDNSIGFGRFLAALSPKVGFTDLSGQGETVQNQKSNYAKRGAVLQYFSHVWHEGGVNDLTAAVGNRTATQLEGDLTGAGGLITTYCPNTPVFATTIIPPTTSSDSWATLGNQTADSNNAQRVQFNTDIRAVPTPYAGCIEFADILESSRNSGKRLTNGTANYYQPDTVHPTRNAYLLAKTSAIISVGTFTR